MVFFFLIALVVFATALDVNAGGDVIPNYAHGFPYPIDGFEHVLAMVAVGFLAVRYAGAGRWLLPTGFILMFAVGISLGMATRWFSQTEVDLAAISSVAVCGLLAISGRRPSLWVALPLIVFFAMFHGYAHGLRVPTSSNAVRYSREIVTATAIILVTGMALGAAVRHLRNRRIPAATAVEPVAA